MKPCSTKGTAASMAKEWASSTLAWTGVKKSERKSAVRACVQGAGSRRRGREGECIAEREGAGVI
jgi:hypothetical protein